MKQGTAVLLAVLLTAAPLTGQQSHQHEESSREGMMMGEASGGMHGMMAMCRMMMDDGGDMSGMHEMGSMGSMMSGGMLSMLSPGMILAARDALALSDAQVSALEALEVDQAMNMHEHGADAAGERSSMDTMLQLLHEDQRAQLDVAMEIMHGMMAGMMKPR